MKQRNNSIDGFVTRRAQKSPLNDRSWQQTDTTIGHMRTDKRGNVEVHTGEGDASLRMQSGQGDGLKQSISDSLQAIDADVQQDTTKKIKRKKRRKVVKWTSLIIGFVIVLVVGFLGYKAWQIGSKIFRGDLLGVFQQQELKKDQYGRSNVLIVGTTDDIRSDGSDGASLTDSMMVVSVDQSKKDVYMFSIPRDLYVQYGMACFSGYAGRINEYFSCVDDGTDDVAEQRRLDGIRQFVGKIFDMDIQYAAHINTSVIRESVDAVGGITVDVQGTNDAPGVYDEIFDQFCREASTVEERKAICPTGHYLDLKNGPNFMDGKKALAFSQARGSMGGTSAYGLDGSNFAREQNQQRVMIALKEKATSTGTLTDINKVMGLMEAMGNNLRSNVDTKEIQTVMKLGAEIQISDIHRLSFIETDNMLMTNASVNSQSVVQPTAGLYNYSEIQAYLKKTIFATPLSKESARVVVLNGSSTAGVAQTEADKLVDIGLDVVFVGNAPEDDYGTYKVYSLTGEGEKPLTRQKLAELYGKSIVDGTPSFGLSVEADFVIVIGTSSELGSE